MSDQNKKVVVHGSPKNGMSSMLAVAALAAAACGGYSPDIGMGRLPRARGNKYFGEDANNVPVPKQTLPTKVRGSDRNEPCECGCGRKRKKCPNGAKNIPPPAHKLERGVYRDQVFVLLRESCGAHHAMTMMELYDKSHVDSYHRDEMVTPECCTEHVVQMYLYDHPGYTLEALHGCGRTQAEERARLETIAVEARSLDADRVSAGAGDLGEARSEAGEGHVRNFDAAA